MTTTVELFNTDGTGTKTKTVDSPPDDSPPVDKTKKAAGFHDVDSAISELGLQGVDRGAVQSMVNEQLSQRKDMRERVGDIGVGRFDVMSRGTSANREQENRAAVVHNLSKGFNTFNVSNFPELQQNKATPSFSYKPSYEQNFNHDVSLELEKLKREKAEKEAELERRRRQNAERTNILVGPYFDSPLTTYVNKERIKREIKEEMEDSQRKQQKQKEIEKMWNDTNKLELNKLKKENKLLDKKLKPRSKSKNAKKSKSPKRAKSPKKTVKKNKK